MEKDIKAIRKLISFLTFIDIIDIIDILLLLSQVVQKDSRRKETYTSFRTPLNYNLMTNGNSHAKD
jgi:hypothetical protein